MANPPAVLLTGATGYIGGRLLSVLQERGLHVRCLSRRPEFIRVPMAPGTELVAGDVLDRESLAGAMEGIHTAYYLIHSMGGGGAFEEMDQRAARNFADAANAAGVSRIIYLGGLGERGSGLSPHLESRHEVGDLLRTHGGDTEVVEFRASIVIGSGSASFEMTRPDSDLRTS